MFSHEMASSITYLINLLSNVFIASRAYQEGEVNQFLYNTVGLQTSNIVDLYYKTYLRNVFVPYTFNIVYI